MEKERTNRSFFISKGRPEGRPKGFTYEFN